MSEQMELFRTLEKDLTFELAPCDRNFDLDAKSGLTKLELTPAQKGKVSALFSQMPAMLASETMAHAYVLKLPEGLSGMNSLMSYRSGGLGTPIMGENGKSLHMLLCMVFPTKLCFSAALLQCRLLPDNIFLPRFIASLR